MSIRTLSGHALYRIVAFLMWLGRYKTRRVRVVVRHGSDILLVQNWLGPGEWTFPGGGLKQHEDVVRCAHRELKEELGIVLPRSKIKPSGSLAYKHHGVRYRVELASVRLLLKPTLRVHPELNCAEWFSIDQLPANLSPAIRRALFRHLI